MSELQIFDEWSTYEKVVANDYMHHQKFFALLMEQLEARFDRPLSIIDIGCGDAAPVTELLERFPVERYVGIDQSEAALERGHAALEKIGVRYELRAGSMLDELKKLDEPFDLAIASYALHHLDSELKRAALVECRRLLRPGGIVAVIDVYLEASESRSAYKKRWEDNARRTFTALAQEELEVLLEHVRDSDIPETVSAYRRFGLSAGFDAVESLWKDPQGLNRLVMLYS